MLTELAPHDTAPLPAAALLAESDRRDRELRARLGAWRDGYDCGYRAGRQDEASERDEAWNRIAEAAVRGLPHDELEERRWGPGGRARFGDPRPSDYQGREGAT